MTSNPPERIPSEEIERLTLENWQLKGALGYPVPGDIPQGNFKCGLCEARSLSPAAGEGGEDKSLENRVVGTQETDATIPQQLHTPGPWDTQRVMGPYLSVVSPAGDAELGNWMVAERVRWDVDASLIAAAPDLLKALQEITATVRREPANPFLADKMDRIAIAAIAAIAKATPTPQAGE